MPIRNDVLHDPHFWAALLCCSLGFIADEEPDRSAICAALGVDEDAASNWLGDFDGSQDDNLDEESFDPPTVALTLRGGVELLMKSYPDGFDWVLKSGDGTEAKLANVSGHWRLPGLRWSEAQDIAAGAANKNVALLLMLPIVWLTDEDDPSEARKVAADAWRASKLAGEAEGKILADIWAKSVEGGREHPWREENSQWIPSAHWSYRSGKLLSVDSAVINRLVAIVLGK